MSGGFFDYKQYQIDQSADELQSYIDIYLCDHTDDSSYKPEFSSETWLKFAECIILLRKAAILLHRIDWLISGDDSEETFHKRLEEDLQNIRI